MQVEGSWLTLKAVGKTAPLGRSSGVMGVIGDTVVVFSGENAPRVPVDAGAWCYSLSENTWTHIECKGQAQPAARVGTVSLAFESDAPCIFT